MTNKEAINYLKRNMATDEDDANRYHNEVLEFTIKALEQEPCEDAISRKAVKELFQEGSVMGMYHFLGIDELPSITPAKCIATIRFSKEDMKELVDEKMKDIVIERKKGKWIVLKDEYGDICEAICSCCEDNGNHRWKYCPNCGAKMEEEVEAIT